MKLILGLIVSNLAPFAFAVDANASSNGRGLRHRNTGEVDEKDRALPSNYDCDLGCGLDVVGHGPPVCGADGNTYFNECLAICQNIDIARNGVCPGDPPIQDNDPSYVRSGVVAKEVLDVFKGEGFKFTAKRVLNKDLPLDDLPEDDVAQGFHDGNDNSNSNGNGNGNGNGNVPSVFRGVRIDEEGNEYKTDEIVVVPEFSGPLEYEAHEPEENNTDGNGRFLVVLGVDTRTSVTSTTSIPYKYIGQLVQEEGNGGVSWCTGTVVSATSILTNAHCVYDRSSQQWKRPTYFAPARYRSGSLVKDPYGRFNYQSATIYQAYINGDSSNYDFAIVNLYPQNGQFVGGKVGYAGLAWTSYGDSELNAITVTGYPGDKSFGGMWTSGSCQAAESGGVGGYSLKHYCDTAGGNSGSALMDTQSGYIRGVHCGGASSSNVGIALRDIHWQSLIDWSGR